MNEGTLAGKEVSADEAIEMLRNDVLGRNAEAKRFLMDVEQANMPPTVCWMGTMTVVGKIEFAG